jgi:hypothetical protein
MLHNIFSFSRETIIIMLHDLLLKEGYFTFSFLFSRKKNQFYIHFREKQLSYFIIFERNYKLRLIDIMEHDVFLRGLEKCLYFLSFSRNIFEKI